jgi:hypothetical protein
VLFDNLSENSQHRVSALRNERSAVPNSSKPRGMYEVHPSDNLPQQVAALTQKLDQLLCAGHNPLVPPTPPAFAEACGICMSPTHYTTECPSASQYPEFVHEQVQAAQGYSRPTNDPYSQTYNSGWRNHPNFSWKQPGQAAPSFPPQRPSYPNNQAAYPRPPQAYNPAPPPPEKQRSPNFEEQVLKSL